MKPMSLHHLPDRFVVISLHLEVADLAIALGGFDPGVAQKVLYGHQVGIGIE